MNNCLFLDIETIPTQNADLESEIRASVKPPGNISKQETIDKWWAEKGGTAAEEAYRKTALDGSKGEIISIAWAFNDDDVVCDYREQGWSEQNLLHGFYRNISEKIITEDIGFFTRVIHGSKNLFDLRFLFQRSVILGVKPSFELHQDSRYNGDHTFDTMTCFAGFMGYVSLDSLCTTLGIDSPKSKMTGSEVWDYFKAGRIDEIAEYNIDDVRALREVYRRLTFQKIGGRYEPA